MKACLIRGRTTWKPPPRLNLIQWADTYRHVAAKTSAAPGRWRTAAQPVAFGPMHAVTERDTHTVSVKAGTQVLKTELLINVAGYFIHQDPSPILFIQPTQGAAEAFSKERFGPTVAATPALRRLVKTPKARDSENTITHKDYPGGSLDFVGANSPTDLASRPKRIILADEISKYPPSAGAEGDPLKLGEERASTYKDVGRAKFVRTCSPTVKANAGSRESIRPAISASALWPVRIVGTSRFSRGRTSAGTRGCERRTPSGHGGIACEECGVVWTEPERRQALADLAMAPDYGWRQTRKFLCCGEEQTPEMWDDAGRSLCRVCGQRSPYDGHAGFHASKLYSVRHRLSDLVREFLEAKGDPELLKKFQNTALAEEWEPQGGEGLDATGFIARAEPYGPDDLPEAVYVMTGFCDVQGDRLEVQLIGWGANEEAWPFVYEVIHLDPAQPAAWRELDALRSRKFTTRDGRILRVAAFGLDTGGHHGAQVHAYCRRRRGQRVFACKGVAGNRPIWPTHASRSKSNDALWLVGVDSAKDALYARLRIAEPGPGQGHSKKALGGEEDGIETVLGQGLANGRERSRQRPR